MGVQDAAKRTLSCPENSTYSQPESQFWFLFPPHHLDLLQDLLVGQESLRHEDTDGGLVLLEANRENYLEA